MKVFSPCCKAAVYMVKNETREKGIGYECSKCAKDISDEIEEMKEKAWSN